MVPEPAGTKWHHFTPSEQLCLSCSSCEVKLQGASYEDPESGFMTFCISSSVPSQNLKTSYRVSLIVYVNTARNTNASVCLGGLQVSEDVGQQGASYSACRFVYALGFFFFLLVLILNNIPTIEGCKKTISVYAGITCY